MDAVRPQVLFTRLFHDPPAPFRAWQEAPARFLLCLGKASIDSAGAILRQTSCQDHFVLSPYGGASTLNVHIGSHPVPNQKSRHATRELLQWLSSLPSDSNLLVVLSGGTSALLVSPLPGLSLNSKMLVNQMLIRSGASIQEINAVRKHLSSVKGGQLARYTGNLKCLVLVISDVIGDDLSTIGSGPFYPDPSTFLDARRILQQYQLWDQVPEDVREILQNGIGGTLPETPKSNPAGIPHIIVGSNEIARLAAAERAKQLGYEVDLWPESLSALVGEVATLFEDSIRKNGSNRALIAGGEITIQVQGTGMGGRNQHLALLMAQKIAGKNIVFGAIGTDGIDGNSPAAGAWADGQTFDRASGEETFRSAVEECDSYHYFQRIGQNIVTGPTGTNVMDLYVALT